LPRAAQPSAYSRTGGLAYPPGHASILETLAKDQLIVSECRPRLIQRG
jgi:hypothetical protein